MYDDIGNGPPQQHNIVRKFDRHPVGFGDLNRALHVGREARP